MNRKAITRQSAVCSVLVGLDGCCPIVHVWSYELNEINHKLLSVCSYIWHEPNGNTVIVGMVFRLYCNYFIAFVKIIKK